MNIVQTDKLCYHLKYSDCQHNFFLSFGAYHVYPVYNTSVAVFCQPQGRWESVKFFEQQLNRETTWDKFEFDVF